MENQSFIKIDEKRPRIAGLLPRLVMLLKSLFGPDRSVFLSSFYLVSTTVIVSVLGYLFWVIAARKYTSLDVGVGASYINIVTLIALLGDMGFGITAMRYIALLGNESRSFINTVMVAEVVITSIISILFILVMPLWSEDLQLITSNGFYIVILIGSILALLLAQLFDKYYIACNKANFYFFRNILSGVIRVIYLLFIGTNFGALHIVYSVGLGSFLTLIISLFFFMPRTIPSYSFRFEFSFKLIRERMSYALSNHGSQLLFALTPLLYPLVIVRLLGPEANAMFYLCWMIANILYIIPFSIATSTFAKIARSPVHDFGILWKYLILTVIGMVFFIPIFILLGPWILGFFGADYRLASGLLSWLFVLSIPYAINIFAVTFFRLNNNITGLLVVAGIPAIFSLVFMVAGSSIGSLPGVGIGLLLAQLIGVIFSLKALAAIPISFKITQKGTEDV